MKADLVGMEYEPLYTYMPLNGKKAYYVASADFVSLEDGTYRAHGRHVRRVDYNGAEISAAVADADDQGKFFDFVTPFTGMFFKKAEQHVVDDLKARGLLLKDSEYI